MDYQYDVFFSYKRDRESDAWHLWVMGKVQHWLKHELARESVPIFFDTEEIRTGLRWRHKLATALRSSRTIVCIWSPLYFQSKWCVSEWQTFAARELAFDCELVVPARYHDGDSFPPAAKEVQAMDFSDYTSTAPGFWKTPLAVEFEHDRIKDFARDLALRIRQAPPFQPDFPVVEVPDSQIGPEPVIGRPADV